MSTVPSTKGQDNSHFIWGNFRKSTESGAQDVVIDEYEVFKQIMKCACHGGKTMQEFKKIFCIKVHFFLCFVNFLNLNAFSRVTCAAELQFLVNKLSSSRGNSTSAFASWEYSIKMLWDASTKALKLLVWEAVWALGGEGGKEQRLGFESWSAWGPSWPWMNPVTSLHVISVSTEWRWEWY